MIRWGFEFDGTWATREPHALLISDLFEPPFITEDRSFDGARFLSTRNFKPRRLNYKSSPALEAKQ